MKLVQSMADRTILFRSWPMLLLALVGRASVGAITFLLPLYLIRQSFSPFEVALIIGVGSFSRIPASLIAGLLADKYSARTMLLFASVITTLFGIFVGVINILFLKLIIMVVWVAASSIIFVTLNVTGVKTYSQQQATILGFINMAALFGTSVGPVLAGWIVVMAGYLRAFLFCSLPVAGVGMLFLLLFKNEALSGRATGFPIKLAHGQLSWSLLKNASFSVLLFSCDMLITSAWTIYLPISLSQHGWSIAEVGKLVSLQIVVYSLSQPLSSYIADRFGHKIVLTVGLLAYALLISGTAFVDQKFLIYIFILLSGLFASPIYTAGMASVTTSVPEELRGKIVGAMSTVSTISSAIGAILAGQAVWIVGSAAGGFMFSFPLALAVLLCVLPLSQNSGRAVSKKSSQ